MGRLPDMALFLSAGKETGIEMSEWDQRILMGNEAIGRGLVESGCELFASYPGTPASEILPAVRAFSKETETAMHIEWSVNEKVALEVALAASYTGKRAAVAMKQVGLNVAADPLTRAAYLGCIGGLVVVVADDPGPHSSQTEQDSRLFSLFAKLPVLDPASPGQAKELARDAFELSEKYEIPVILRPSTRVCHSRQNVGCSLPQRLSRKPEFKKNPGRWIATPMFLTNLHKLLNEKLDAIAAEPRYYPKLIAGDGSMASTCVIASGAAFANTHELLEDMGYLGKVDLYQVILPYPLNRPFIKDVRSRYGNILIIEETYPVIELQLSTEKTSGKRDGYVPRQGEMTPEVIQDVLIRFLGVKSDRPEYPAPSKGKRPTLCAGCPHRASFYAIKDTFPGGIFPSDIGCYTLGMNLGAIDTCHCMGACVSQGAGFYHAYVLSGDAVPPIVVTIGDSTFFHSGIPGLINAVFQKTRFILAILDNSTTAMTGNQPTPQVGTLADGQAGNPVYIKDLVKACGVRFIRECDPYDMKQFIVELKQADQFVRSPEGGVAVIISKHPCILDREGRTGQKTYRVSVTDECVGCRHCIEDFECPAILFDEELQQAKIDEIACIGCGVCEHTCPVYAIGCEEVKP
jgi:indolepyruvate ferredoxin oxidoreductase, alpha subunit